MPPRSVTFLVLIAIVILLDRSEARLTRQLRDTSSYKFKRSENHDGGHASFGYENPSDWLDNYPTCAGSRQSPINIELQAVKMMEKKHKPLKRFGYDIKPLEMSIVNNGHSVELRGVWPPNETPTVFGGPLTGPYEFAQLHFHWGETNDVGSEHTVAKHSFPLEMHMVHWKKSYNNITEAVKHSDGIVVLGYLLSLDKNANIGIQRMRVGFSSILKPNEKTSLEPFPLSLFDLDLSKEGYVTYSGSLTTPPCAEAVTWILSVRIKNVNIDELESFRKLQLSNNDKHNYRPTQPLNGRSIFYLYEK